VAPQGGFTLYYEGPPPEVPSNPPSSEVSAMEPEEDDRDHSTAV
jgi:hypothetical protein